MYKLTEEELNDINMYKCTNCDNSGKVNGFECSMCKGVGRCTKSRWLEYMEELDYDNYIGATGSGGYL